MPTLRDYHLLLWVLSGSDPNRRSLKDIERFQVAYVNQYHITEQKLLDTNVNVINRYYRFLLPKLWGLGQRVSADGTKWDVTSRLAR